MPLVEEEKDHLNVVAKSSSGKKTRVEPEKGHTTIWKIARVFLGLVNVRKFYQSNMIVNVSSYR